MTVRKIQWELEQWQRSVGEDVTAGKLWGDKGQRAKCWGLRLMSGVLLWLCKAMGLEMQVHRYFRPTHTTKSDSHTSSRWMPGNAIDARDNTIQKCARRRQASGFLKAMPSEEALKEWREGDPRLIKAKLWVLRNISLSEHPKTKGLHAK